MTGKKSNAFARPAPPARPSVLQPPPTRFGAPPVQAKPANPSALASVVHPPPSRFATPSIHAKPILPTAPTRGLVLSAPTPRVGPAIAVQPKTTQSKGPQPPGSPLLATSAPASPSRFAAPPVPAKPVWTPTRAPVARQTVARQAAQAKPTAPQRPSAARPQTIQKMQSLPIYSLKKTEPEFNQLYRNLSSTEAQYYRDFALEIHKEVMKKNSKLMDKSNPSAFSKPIQDNLWQLLENHRGMHVASVPALKAGWDDALINYNGAKTNAALYAHIRSSDPFKDALKGSAVKFDDDIYARAYPEVHHLIYKSIEPTYAYHPWNLMVATRGGTDGFGNSVYGQHEALWHTVSAGEMSGKYGGGSSIYDTLVPAVGEVVKSWAGQTPSLYPTQQVVPFSFNSSKLISQYSATQHYSISSISSISSATCDFYLPIQGRNCMRSPKVGSTRCPWHINCP